MPEPAEPAAKDASPVPSSAEAVFCAIASACIDDLDRSLAEFMATSAPEGPHKARVALRRLTTALDAFKPLMCKAEAKALRVRAKAIFRRLGRVRDADVYDQTKGGEGASTETEALRQAVRSALRRRDALKFGPLLRRKLKVSGGITHFKIAITIFMSKPIDDCSVDGTHQKVNGQQQP